MLKIDDIVTLNRKKNTIRFNYLGEIINPEKLIPSNFGRIKHLDGSRLIDQKDSYMDKKGQEIFTVKKNNLLDRIYITEKIDGMNAGLIKQYGEFYPIARKGYDVRTNILHRDGTINWLFFTWAYFCASYIKEMKNNGEEELLNKLPDNFRFVFENAMLTHSLKYNFKKVNYPVFLLAVYEGEKKLNVRETNMYASKYHFQRPPVLATNIAIDPKIVVDQYGQGIVGCKDPDGMEGIVYVYEKYNEKEKDYRIVSLAKYVSNIKAGTSDTFPEKYNDWNRRTMLHYLNLKRTVYDYWYGDNDNMDTIERSENIGDNPTT